MPDRGEFRFAARIDVHRAADDRRADRQSANQSAAQIADPLHPKFPTRWGAALLRIDLVDSLEVQKRFERSDRRDRQTRRVDGGIGPLREIGRLEKTEELPEAAGDWHLHQMRLLKDPRAAEALQHEVAHGTE